MDRDYDYLFDEENFEREGVLVVYGNCSCDERYTCRNCLQKM